MKQHFITIWAFCLIVIIVFSCKKEHQDSSSPLPVPPVYCYDTSYWDTIPKPTTQFYLGKYIEDGDFNIIYAWKGGDKLTSDLNITKLDSSLTEVWSETYPEIEGQLTNLIHDDQNNLFLTTYLSSYSKEGDEYYYENVYLQSGLHNDTCAPRYQLVSDSFGAYYTDNSKSWIYKISPTGDLLWSSEISWSCSNGKNIEILSNGDIATATYTLVWGNVEFVYRDGVFQDTILQPDSTYLNIFKLSPSGSVIWEKDIKIPTFLNHEWYSGFHRDISINITSTDQAIYVAAFNAIYTYDYDGVLLNKYELSNNYCAHYIYRGTRISEGSMYLLCKYSEPDLGIYNPIRYVARYSPPDQLEWIEEAAPWGKAEIRKPPDDGYYLYYNDDVISKHSTDGILEWRKDQLYHFQKLDINCNNGVLLFQDFLTSFPDHIKICRSDENGEF